MEAATFAIKLSVWGGVLCLRANCLPQQTAVIVKGDCAHVEAATGIMSKNFLLEEAGVTSFLAKHAVVRGEGARVVADAILELQNNAALLRV